MTQLATVGWFNNSTKMAENTNTFAGTHEVQECLAGESEANLTIYWSSCAKNPGHKGFIPVKSFTIDHLPDRHRDEDLYKLTKAIADLTVRVAVEYTSLARPELDPITKVPYPSYNSRGTRLWRTGTGMVFNVDMYSEGMEELEDKKYRTCPCPECDRSDTPSKVWWELKVMTARHVVFDDSEAKMSRCRLWFDDDQSPVIVVTGLKVDATDTEGDLCVFYCATHDSQIANKLEEMVKQFADLRYHISNESRNQDRLTIIVSHPHGCSKQVSVGEWVEKQVVVPLRYKNTRYTYTTCTCAGSSGAFVYILGCYWAYRPHAGYNTGGFNYSGVLNDFDL